MLAKEIKKIFKLKSFRCMTFFNLVVLIFFLLKEESKSNFFNYYINVVLDISDVVFFYNIFICIIIGEIVSEEIKTGAIYHLIINQKSIRSVIINKIFSSILLTFFILTFDLLFISIVGFFRKEITPLVVFGNTKEIILNDNYINNSIIRITFFNINLFFGIIINTLLSLIVSIISSNKISSIISSFVVMIIATYPINIKGEVYSLVFYKLPLIRLYIPIVDYVKYMKSNFITYIVSIFILIILAKLSWRFRNEV